LVLAGAEPHTFSSYPDFPDYMSIIDDKLVVSPTDFIGTMDLDLFLQQGDYSDSDYA